MKRIFDGCTLVAILMLSFGPSLAKADTIFGIYAGIGIWLSDYDGDFASEGDDDVDLVSDLRLDDEDANHIYVAIEHPLPLIPNIRLQRTELSADQDSILGTDIVFDGRSFSTNEDIVSTLDLTHTDATLYYELLDNWVSLDLGLTVRAFEGEASIEGIDSSSNEPVVAQQDIDVPIPMLYGKAKFELPFTGFAVEAEGNLIQVSGNGITDLSVKLGYESKIGLGAELGYRQFALELDDEDDFSAEINVDGIYLGLSLHI